MRRFYVENGLAAGSQAVLTGDEAHHIKTVLRMQPGASIELVDGSGYTYPSRIKEITDDQVIVDVNNKYHTGVESNLRLTMAIGFLKEKKMDVLVRHLTELGISRFLPVLTARSIAKPSDKRLASRIARWQIIAKEAVKQSRRTCIPKIESPLSFDSALAVAVHSDKKIIFWENAKSVFADSEGVAPPAKDVFVLLGPEGGFTEQEAVAASKHGFTPVSMGPRILRAETAAIAACTLIQYLFGDICKKPLDSLSDYSLYNY